MVRISSMHITIWVAFTALFQACQTQSNSSLNFDQCWVDSDPIMFYGWARPEEGLEFPGGSDYVVATKTKMNATVVTMVDTIFNITKVTTSLPSEWTPPPTNAAGTRTQLITIANSTVTLAFPTVFIQWPTEYTYCANPSSGMFRGRRSNSIAKRAGPPTEYCNSPTVPITTPLNSPPQPTKPLNLAGYNYVDPEKLSDPKGLLAMAVSCNGTHAVQPACSLLLGPVHPAFKCHSLGIDFPHGAGLDESWMNLAVKTTTVNMDPTSTPESQQESVGEVGACTAKVL